MMSRGETCAYLRWYYFRLTTPELLDYETGRVGVLEDRKRPILERRRFYKLPAHAEPRMFRYRPMMKWPLGASFPHHAGFVARERLPVRHYPHRDPIQMEKRYALRAAMMRSGSAAGPHWNLEDWRKDVIEYDRFTGLATERTAPAEGLSAAREHTTGPLYKWNPGEILPSVSDSSHLSPHPKRLLQRLIHSPVLRFLDHIHVGWPAGFDPELLDAPVREP
jgi:hypothetical protein